MAALLRVRGKKETDVNAPLVPFQSRGAFEIQSFPQFLSFNEHFLFFGGYPRADGGMLRVLLSGHGRAKGHTYTEGCRELGAIHPYQRSLIIIENTDKQEEGTKLRQK